MGVHGEDEVDDILYVVRVEEILDGIIICRCSDDDEVSIPISSDSIEGGGKV